MRDLYNGTPYELMPEILRTPESEAISYAISEGLKKLLDDAKRISLYGEISQVPDEVLDAMAAESRTQYYDPGASRKIREDMVRQTFGWYMHGGTSSIISEYLATLYGGGQVEEWYDYGGEPYFFKAIVIVAEETVLPAGSSKEIIRRINGYKNVRSWLEALIFRISFEVQIPIEIEAGLRLFIEYYPRQNLVPLLLDGTWKLNGGRKLNGYWSDRKADFYPMAVGVFAEADAEPDFQAGGMQIGISVEEEIICELRAAMEADAQEDLTYETAMTVGTGVKVGVRTDGGVYTGRILDGTWKLDGSRKLDGGWIAL